MSSIITDATAALRDLESRASMLGSAARAAAEAICAGQEGLSGSVVRLLEYDGVSSSHRLLPFVILAMLGEEPDLAMPVCVLSRLWWAGAETLDDITDGDFDARRAGLTPAQAIIASIACLSVVPQQVIERQAPSRAVARAWREEFADTSIRCAGGQFDDLTIRPEDISWQKAMRVYAGKNGAPYARDAAMSAIAAGQTGQAVRAWRTFGALFGVIRQLSNDREPRSSDVANGVPTLLLAHAAGRWTARGEQAMLGRYELARTDPSARHEAIAWLTTPEIVTSYNERVDQLRRHLAVLLSELAGPSPHRDLARSMIEVSARTASLAPPAGRTSSTVDSLRLISERH